MNKLKLNQFAEVIMGQSPKGSSYNKNGEGIKLLNGAADFYKQGIFPKKSTTKPIKLSQKGDILLCIRATIGNAIISDDEYCLGRGVVAIRVNNKFIETKYALYLIEQKVLHLAYRALGSTIKGIKKTDLDNLEFNIPPLPIQKKIVSILEKTELLKQKREETNKETQSIIKSIFYDMFGDPMKNEKGWDIKTLNDVCKNLFAGGDVPKDNFSKEESKEYQIPIYSNGTGDKALYGYTNIRKVQEDSITISARGTIGYPVIRKAPFYPIIRLIVATPDINKVNLEYFKEAISLFKFNKGGTSIPQLTVPMIKYYKILIPPLKFQEEFAKKVQLIESIQSKQQSSTEEINTLFNVLMQKAFKGELVK